MHKHSLAALALVALLGGCPTTITCPAGSTFVAGVCIVQDGGTMTDTPPELDAPEGSDAGPCNGECDGTATPFCDTTTNECVECLTPTDCEAAEDLACIEGVCEQCETNAECTTAELSVCNTTSHTCEACDGNEDCGHDGLPGLCSAGVCVQCTNADESACSGNVCDVENGTCTTTVQGSVGVCQPCLSDSACMTGNSCVLQRFDEPPVDGTLVDIGYFCLPNGPTCPLAGAPFVSVTSLMDHADDATMVCDLRVTTCEAYAGYGMGPCTLDSDCGAMDVDDGICRMRAGVGMQCTTRCVGAEDCNSGIACNATAPRFCCFGPTCT